MKKLADKQLSKTLTFTCLSLLLLTFSFFACTSGKNAVKNIAEFNAAVEKAQPGDKIVLANGVWKDAELVFKGKGTAEKPITLTVETKGKVTFEGLSNLSMSGEYLVVEGLVFKNGFTPTSEVISTRTSKTELSNHCRITECVIDNFSNPERFESDYWVGIYGKNNRFDHNYLTGKRNHGVTLAVRLTTKESQENHTLVDHNYFGPRPILGANGGETLRIGTSHHSLTNSNTVVEYNYFDRCNGEHEIISNKSCQNIYRNNTFNECQGTLTMRHGNETLVEGNYFFGNGKSNTGGIRIINEKQKVVNNYCEGLTGYRFRGALVIMNGVPNSPLNRYFQVLDSEASNNSFINCDYIQLCAGSDAERSATPQNSKVEKNIFYNEKKNDIFTVYDDISGIAFNGNLTSENVEKITKTGFESTKLTFKRNKNGILQAEGDTKGAGFLGTDDRGTAENTGVSWYPRVEEEIRLGTGKIITVQAGINTLGDAISTSTAGDILELEAGTFTETKSIDLRHPITIRGKANNASKAKILFERTSLFNIENGGSLALDNVIIDGSEAPDAHGNAVIRTSRYSMSRNYKLFIENCDFQDMDINHTFDILRVYKNTFADSIVLRNSNFADVDGNILPLDQETDDIGIYNAENVVITGCNFSNVTGSVLNLHRGGSDESTFGPMLAIDQCELNNIGKGKRNKTGASIALHGVQWVNITNSKFGESNPLNMFLAVGEPITQIKDCVFEKTGKIESNSTAYQIEGVTYK